MNKQVFKSFLPSELQEEFDIQYKKDLFEAFTEGAKQMRKKLRGY